MKPVFLLAPMNRSGTHFLRETLLCHPLVSRGPLGEDYIPAYCHLLLEFAERAERHWYDPKKDAGDRFLDGLRQMLLEFFSTHPTND